MTLSCGNLCAQLNGEVVVQLDCDDAGRACCQGSGDGAAAGADFNYGSAGEIAERGNDALGGLGVVEEVLAEFGLGGHGLSRW